MLVLTIWFGAVHHCDAEIAFSLCDQAACCDAQQGCADDGCETVERGDYRTNETNLKIPVPIVAWLSFLDAPAIDPAASNPTLPNGEIVTERPLDWVPSWHFVRRAAPPSRAPSSVLA